jgi:hypothetical protein
LVWIYFNRPNTRVLIRAAIWHKRHHVAVLGVPPINSALDAVRAYVMAHIEKQR